MERQKGVRIEALAVPFQYRTMEEIEREQPAQEELPHRHDYYALLWVQSGSGTHQIDFRDYPITGNSIHIVSPGQVHFFQPLGMPQGHVLLFTERFLLDAGFDERQRQQIGLFFDCEETPPFPVAAAELTALTGMIELIKAETHHGLLGAYLKAFLLLCARSKNRQHSVSESKPSVTRQQQIVADFKRNLEAGFRESHQVQAYAAAQHLSPVYLNEVVKQLTGKSAKQYIQNRIVLEAKRLALYSDWTMKRIAFHLGFTDTSHFSKLFKKVEGRPFSQFRN